MGDPEIDELSRAARRHRRLGVDAACTVCGGTEHLSRRPDGRILCYEDLQAARGVARVEGDHVAGQANDAATVRPAWGNDHRTVTDWRRVLGIDAWPRAEGDPLVAAAHLLAGLAVHILVIARWLVALAADAAGRLGPNGWDGAPRPPVLP